jgi:outer membrane receptor protein involved in Fe transport
VARSTWRFKRDDRLTLEASAEGALNALDTRSDFASDGAPVALPTGDVDIRERRAEFGTLATWKPVDDISLTAALKLETSTLSSERDVVLERSLTYLKPRLLLAWTADEKTQVRLRLEREVGQIAFNNFVASVEVGAGLVRVGNPDLRPRTAWVGEAVVERQFWTGGSVVLTARRLEIQDVVDLAPLPQFGGALGVANIGDAVQSEFVATITLPLKRVGLDGVSLKGGATYSDSRVTDPTTGTPRPLGGSNFRADAHFAHDLPMWKLNWGVDAFYYGEGIRYRPTTVETFQGHLQLSAFVEYRAKPDLTLRLEGSNLTNPRSSWRVDTYAGPRGSAPLLYTEERRMSGGAYGMVRVRKTLN